MALICLMRTSCHQIALFPTDIFMRNVPKWREICMEFDCKLIGSSTCDVTSYQTLGSDLRFNKVSRGLCPWVVVISKCPDNGRRRRNKFRPQKKKRKRIYRGASSDNSCFYGPHNTSHNIRFTLSTPSRERVRRHFYETHAGCYTRANTPLTPTALVADHKSNVDDATQ